jgi:hypothetical protein
MLKGLHLVIRAMQPALVDRLRKFWSESRPDMVVSLIPNFNRALWLSLQAALPGTPLVTVLTDIADYPPHFWIERQPQYLVCGSARAVGQARQLGHPDGCIFRTSGMILNPRFYEPITVDRGAGRQRLGLNPEMPTGLVLFGGEGSMTMREIAGRLQSTARPLQLILICGRNQKLAAELRSMRSRIPMFVEGFTREIPYYMHLADFFIGKPGPGQHQRGDRHEAAGDCGAQRLEPAAGALQHGVGAGTAGGAGAAQFPADRAGGRGAAGAGNVCCNAGARRRAD